MPAGQSAVDESVYDAGLEWQKDWAELKWTDSRGAEEWFGLL